MSLILEALKKSEAKRRLGEAPDLGTPFSAPRRRSKVLPVVAVLIVAALIWWVVRSPAPAPSAPKIDATAQAPSPKPVSPPPTPGQKSGPPLHAVTGDNNLQPGAAPTNLPKAAPPPRTDDAFVASGPLNANPMANGGARRTPEEIRERRRGNADSSAQSLSNSGSRHATSPNAVASSGRPTAKAPAPAPAAPKAVAAPPPQVAVSPTQTAPAEPVPHTAANAANSVATRAPKTAGTIGLTPTTPAADAPSPPAAKTPVPGASAQPYSELPFSVRKSLPELRLSMHVYMPDPAQRFVILNDSRITEGEKTTDDINVREIRPDGVVLEFQGQRFFYPRDGL